MKTYNNINDYIKESKQNDIIVLAGRGLIDGIKTLRSKHDTLKLIRVTDEKIVVRKYRGKSNYVVYNFNYNQQVAVLTKAEFNKLVVLW